MMPGFYITVEGTEGCGKSTQLTMLYERLLVNGFPVERTKEPGGTDIGLDIRGTLLNPKHKGKMLPETESLLFWAERFQHHNEYVKPALARGVVVLGDRDVDSSWAYQHYARGIPREWMSALQEQVIQDFRPDLTLLYDGPVETFLERVAKRNKERDGSESRFDDEAADFHKRVRAGFLDLAKQHSKRFVVLDGTKKVDALHEQTYSVVWTFLKDKLV